MANFLIRTQKKNGTATLYVRVQRRSPKIDWTVSTGIEVSVNDWRKFYESGNAKKWGKYTQEGAGAKLKEKMDLIDQTINLLFNQGRIKDGTKQFRDLLYDALFDIENHDAIVMQEEIKQREKEEEERRMHEIVPCCKRFIDGITDGSITDKKLRGSKYTIGTIRNWGTFYEYLKDYTANGMTFEDITEEWVQRFRLHMEKIGLMPTTINKHFGTGQKLCNYAASKGWNRNAVSLKAWKTTKINPGDRQTEIYLTDEELDALYNMPLEGQRDKVRDLFFLGVFSGQRVSDYSMFNRHNFGKTEKGTDIIRLNQKKTGVYVEVPILDPRCYDILRKYDYKSPEVPLQRVNLILKEIFKKLATSVPSLMQEYTTVMTRREKDAEKTYMALMKMAMENKPMNNNQRADFRRMQQYAKEHDGTPVYRRDGQGHIIKYKWELVTSHTARRSAITNLINEGILTEREIRSISGHTSYKNFDKYVMTGPSEVADRINEKRNTKAKEVQLKKA